MTIRHHNEKVYNELPDARDENFKVLNATRDQHITINVCLHVICSVKYLCSNLSVSTLVSRLIIYSDF